MRWVLVWWCRIDCSTCWPAVHRTTTVLRMPPTNEAEIKEKCSFEEYHIEQGNSRRLHVSCHTHDRFHPQKAQVMVTLKIRSRSAKWQGLKHDQYRHWSHTGMTSTAWIWRCRAGKEKHNVACSHWKFGLQLPKVSRVLCIISMDLGAKWVRSSYWGMCDKSSRWIDGFAF